MASCGIRLGAWNYRWDNIMPIIKNAYISSSKNLAK